MRPSLCAIYAWHALCPDQSIEAQFERAKPATKKQRKKAIEKIGSRFSGQYMRRKVYFLKTKCGPLLVVAKGGYILNVVEDQ